MDRINGYITIHMTGDARSVVDMKYRTATIYPHGIALGGKPIQTAMEVVN